MESIIWREDEAATSLEMRSSCLWGWMDGLIYEGLFFLVCLFLSLECNEYN